MLSAYATESKTLSVALPEVDHAPACTCCSSKLVKLERAATTIAAHARLSEAERRLMEKWFETPTAPTFNPSRRHSTAAMVAFGVGLVAFVFAIVPGVIIAGGMPSNAYIGVASLIALLLGIRFWRKERGAAQQIDAKRFVSHLARVEAHREQVVVRDRLACCTSCLKVVDVETGRSADWFGLLELLH